MRTAKQLSRARSIAEAAGLPFRTATTSRHDEDKALVGIMHLAKGLEFRAVAVIACDENVLPLAERVADVSDEFELDEVIATDDSSSMSPRPEPATGCWSPVWRRDLSFWTLR